MKKNSDLLKFLVFSPQKSLLNGNNTSSDGIELVSNKKDSPPWISFYEIILKNLKEIRNAGSLKINNFIPSSNNEDF